MKILAKLLKPLLRRILLREIRKDEFKAKVISGLNLKLDIPNLTEDEEEKLLLSVFEAASEALQKVLERW